MLKMIKKKDELYTKKLQGRLFDDFCYVSNYINVCEESNHIYIFNLKDYLSSIFFF